MSIQLSEMQKNGVNKAKKWFKNKKKEKLIFVIAGFAGTGKTTIVKSLIQEIGLKEKEVTYIAPTGKAALQLVRNGNNATTIHQLIYVIDKETDDGVTFKKREKDALAGYKLLVVDEVSMVSKEVLIDLLSFGIPIIALGDSGQLEPVGENHGLLHNPDVLLTEIHRQAADNPIIYLSMLAREGKPIKLGKYGDQAYVISKNDKRINIDLLLRADQVLCSYNKTRNALNKKMRKALGFTDILPQKGDKLICTKNNWEESVGEINLINGLIGTVEKVENISNILKINFKPEFGEGVFKDILVTPKPFKGERFTRSDYDYNCFDYGNVITTHKSQGSQWDNVAVYFEPMGDVRKILYTAITRAKEKLVLIV